MPSFDLPRHRSSILLSVLLVILLAIGGCATGPTVVGHWQAEQGTASVRFAADGHFQAVDNQGMAVSGTYRLTGADGIQFEVRHSDNESEVIDARAVRRDDRLTLIFPGETAVETYRLVP